ncbi:MAG: hypothetical protein LJE89_00185 [Deltaproteobacteria bacterium]|nr:hypothetical protein [Deltaproteobacteria bacterium]
MKKITLLLLGLPLLWLVLANATCQSRRGQEDLLNSYEMVRFHLSECRDMGAESLDPVSLEQAVHDSEEIGAMLDKGNWTEASEAMAQLEQTVGLLLDQLKSWDPDEDGLSNYAEYMLYGTSWAESDTDGDGYFDGSEILHFETDPLDYCGVPIGLPPETAVQRYCPALEKMR